MTSVIERQAVILSWSGGKDSALAHQALTKSSQFEVVGLLTTVTRGYDRISVHGVRRSLLHEQAASLRGAHFGSICSPFGCLDDDLIEFGP